MFKTLFTAGAAFVISTTLTFAQTDAEEVLDDATADAGISAAQGANVPDDADLDLAESNAIIALGKGPLAYGTVNSSGAKIIGSSNWSASFNATYNRYEITISSNSYYYMNYATLVTPAGDVRFCKSSSVGGKLLVYCYDHRGAARPSRFAFVTFKP